MESKRQHIILSVLTNVCRFLLAVVFVFSGFVKANDPLGFQYKLGEYVSAFGLAEWMPEAMQTFATIALASVEFTLGVYLFLGTNRRLTLWGIMSLLGVMTPLTLYLALENPISDCGCFGDAIVLTNWQTFWKNVVLLVMAVFVLCTRRRLFRIVTTSSEWLVSVNTLLYIIILSYYSLSNLPVLDFRPYRIGASIPQGMEMPEDAKAPVYETFFIMEKEGERKKFSLEDYPDSTWTFVDRVTEMKEAGYEPPIHDFVLLRMADGEDVTEEVLADSGYTFLMVAHQLETADDSYSDLLNELYDYCRTYGYTFYGLTASTEDMVEQWLDRTGGEYSFCSVDDITLKTIVRSNPGLMLLKGGVVLNKWAYGNVPDEYQLTAPLEQLSLAQESEQNKTMKIVACVLWFILPLMIISLVDQAYSSHKRRRLGRQGDKVETEDKEENIVKPIN